MLVLHAYCGTHVAAYARERLYGFDYPIGLPRFRECAQDTFPRRAYRTLR